MKKLFKHRLILLVCGIFLTGILNAQQVTVSGKVTDANDGSSLPGVNIFEKGTTNGTVTDIEGTYSLSVKTGAVIQISFVGYLTQEVEVGNQSTINFTLEFDAINLKEVVTIGYGTTRKEDATGSVIAVSADEFNQGAITSPQDLVIGKIAGRKFLSGNHLTDCTSRVNRSMAMDFIFQPLKGFTTLPFL